MIELNSPAPEFILPDQNNKEHRLSEYRGKWVVVYFYPKDDTPGCTTEACSFRDDYQELEKNNVQILGISKDSVKSHKKFAEKFNLNFPLLSDPEKTAIHAYNSWGEKKFMGRVFEGILRNTFLINPEGQVARIYEKVTPKGHAGQILNDVRELQP